MINSDWLAKHIKWYLIFNNIAYAHLVGIYVGAQNGVFAFDKILMRHNLKYKSNPWNPPRTRRNIKQPTHTHTHMRIMRQNILWGLYINIHIYTHTHTHIYLYIYMEKCQTWYVHNKIVVGAALKCEKKEAKSISIGKNN